MSVEIGTEAALFPEKEYINAIDVAAHMSSTQVFSPEVPAHRFNCFGIYLCLM